MIFYKRSQTGQKMLTDWFEIIHSCNRKCLLWNRKCLFFIRYATLSNIHLWLKLLLKISINLILH